MSDKMRESTALLTELLDIMVHDSENLDRVANLLSYDCVWVMEPGGTEYRGIEEIRAFMAIAMSSRTHDKGRHKIEIVNAFAGDESLCVEYTHGAIITGAFTLGLKAKIPAGMSRYCITYRVRGGKIDRVHEYINASSWWLSCLVPPALAHLHRLTKQKVANRRMAA